MRMKPRLVSCILHCLLIAVTAIGATARAQDNPSEGELARIIADYESFERAADPVTAGQEGDREALRRLPDARPETEQAQRKQLVALGERLARVDVQQLKPESKLNHALMTR